jgi:hypothetical protein
MADFTDATALGAYKDFNTAVNNFWTVYSAVALGVCGLAIKSPAIDEAPWVRGGLALSFLIFAIGNHVALLRAQTMFVAIADALAKRSSTSAELAPEYRDVFKEIKASSTTGVRAFHISLSICVVVAVLLLPHTK